MTNMTKTNHKTEIRAEKPTKSRFFRLLQQLVYSNRHNKTNILSLLEKYKGLYTITK